MMAKLLLTSALFCFFIQTTESISCYSCTDVTDDSVCTANITCQLRHSCFISIKHVNNAVFTSLGCLDNELCSGVGPGGIIGRKQTHDCLKCCSTDMCNKQLCQQETDGGWSTWSSWSDCSRTCGAGIRTQSRSCTNPAPSINGHDCVGDSKRTESCKKKQCLNSDCSDVKINNSNAADGIYNVVLWKSNRTIQVYCDMTTDGGGWTVFQNRFNGSVDFYRNYSEYVHGFGDLHTEFWLGLDYIQEMTSQYVNELRIDLMAPNGTTAYEVLSPFSLLAPGYVLNVGNTTSSFNILDKDRFGPYHNGTAFSTYDHDVDLAGTVNCAWLYDGAWWFGDCFYTNLNGKYITPGKTGGIVYLSFTWNKSLKQTKMSFRRNQQS